MMFENKQVGAGNQPTVAQQIPDKLAAAQLEKFEKKCEMIEKEVQAIVLIHTKEAAVITD